MFACEKCCNYLDPLQFDISATICGHLFHESCINQLLDGTGQEGQKPICPRCHQRIETKSVIRKLYLKNCVSDLMGDRTLSNPQSLLKLIITKCIDVTSLENQLTESDRMCGMLKDGIVKLNDHATQLSLTAKEYEQLSKLHNLVGSYLANAKDDRHKLQRLIKDNRLANDVSYNIEKQVDETQCQLQSCKFTSEVINYLRRKLASPSTKLSNSSQEASLQQQKKA